MAHMQNLKKTHTNELTYKTETDSHRLKSRSLRFRGRGQKIDWEFGTDMYTLLYLKQTTNKDLLDSTENAAQYFVIT